MSSEELKKKAQEADAAYKKCITCGAHCAVDRTISENMAACNTGN